MQLVEKRHASVLSKVAQSLSQLCIALPGPAVSAAPPSHTLAVVFLHWNLLVKPNTSGDHRLTYNVPNAFDRCRIKLSAETLFLFHPVLPRGGNLM